MSLAIVRSTLMTVLATWAAAQATPVPIVREGVPQSTIKPDLFLETFLIPAATNLVTVSGDRSRLLGIFQINIWTKDNIGPSAAETIAASLTTLFAPVPKTLLPVSVETPLTAHRAILDGAGYRILPCDLTYRLEV